MSEDNQIIIPPSFIALFVPPGRIKPTEPREVIAERYELCEDLARLPRNGETFAIPNSKPGVYAGNPARLLRKI